MLTVKFHVAYIAVDNIVTNERIKYFKSAFPEIFKSSYLFKKHPVVIGLVRLRMENLLYVGHLMRVLKHKIRKILKGKLNMYLLTIIIPAYNAGKFIERTIQRALLVKGSVEIVVVDDGSKDDTYLICKKSRKSMKIFLFILSLMQE